MSIRPKPLASTQAGQVRRLAQWPESIRIATGKANNTGWYVSGLDRINKYFDDPGLAERPNRDTHSQPQSCLRNNKIHFVEATAWTYD